MNEKDFQDIIQNPVEVTFRPYKSFSAIEIRGNPDVVEAVNLLNYVVLKLVEPSRAEKFLDTVKFNKCLKMMRLPYDGSAEESDELSGPVIRHFDT